MGQTRIQREASNALQNSIRAYSLLFFFPGRKGTWKFKLGHVRSNPKQVCTDWLNRNRPLQSSRNEGFSKLPKCPCSLRDVWQKTSFMWTFARRDNGANTVCYRLNRASSVRVYPFGTVSFFSHHNVVCFATHICIME